jgi:hypothetical protein
MAKKLKACSACGKEISKSAKVCPHCGEKNGIKGFRKFFNIVVGSLIVIALVKAFLEVGGGNSSSAQNAKESSAAELRVEAPSESDYQAKSASLNYRAAMLGDYEKGALLRFKGQISQMLNNNTQAMMNTKEEEYVGYAGDAVFLRFNEKPRVVAEDVVEIYARYVGTMKYQTVMGSENEVPSMIVDYYTVFSSE